MIAAIASAILSGVLLQGTADEDAVRRVVLQYYDAQVREDVDEVVGLWSARAAARPTPESLVPLFETGDDQYTVTIRAVHVAGNDATVRVSAR
jgi:hypothetical protein